MMKRNFVLLLLLTGLSAIAQKAPAPFKNGDRVVFAGNSITEAGFYPNYVWLYYITHFPDRKMEVMNGGIGGDVAKQIYTRLEGDLLAKKPDVLVVSFGMNDSKYFEYGMHKDKVDSVRKAAVDTSYNSFKMIEQKLNALPDIRKIMMTSSPYDETVKNEKNYFPGKWKTMEEIVAFQKAAAIKDGWAYVDLFYPMTAMEQQKQKEDSTFTLTGPDRIHPGNAGHFVMAYLFLKAQGLNNQPIADVRIDAAKNKVLQSGNCTISNVSTANNAISFTYLAKSLPFPIDTVARVWGNSQKQSDALDVIPFIKEFDQEMLTVKGLKGNHYSISIDGKAISQCTAQQLNDGINLAILPNTPQYQQAKAIMDLQLKRKELEDKMRAYYWINYDYLNGKGMLFNDSQASLDSVMSAAKKDFFVASKKDVYAEVRSPETREKIQEQMNEMRDEMYKMAQPTAHLISIKQID
ncbi:GDSL family lipase [Ilyomonas limi]|uniref:GDSL family lipase n=1 Tax=Ilyomonas limi TaxID=2575867 RepID=A0A4U3L178_9BACT|nr:SGNH/GDSL hydrolase family protein [Ilyomonas limi]TKK67944.1 GDSL family lipase [Ilyomonas limi]